MIYLIVGGDFDALGVGIYSTKVIVGNEILDRSEIVANFPVKQEIEEKFSYPSAALGLVAFGPLGLYLGSLNSKIKSKYHVAIVFKDGRRAIVESDTPHLDI
ncbi:MAG: hypothetical protein Q4G54_05940 [Pelistega sp.]|nr:hypothetical protein [Pelistega sp.]